MTLWERCDNTNKEIVESGMERRDAGKVMILA